MITSYIWFILEFIMYFHECGQWIIQQFNELDTIIILQMMKPNLRELKWLSQAHRAVRIKDLGSIMPDLRMVSLMALLFLANISLSYHRLHTKWSMNLQVFFSEICSSLWCCVADFADLKGFMHVCVSAHVLVCVHAGVHVRQRMREREWECTYPAHLGGCPLAKHTWYSAHTCKIWMSFVPWESHSAWLIQAELSAASL